MWKIDKRELTERKASGKDAVKDPLLWQPVNRDHQWFIEPLFRNVKLPNKLIHRTTTNVLRNVFDARASAIGYFHER
jgi:hypothetical protein